jgi:hypothetical protein
VAVAAVVVTVVALIQMRRFTGGPAARPVPLQVICESCGRDEKSRVRGRPPYTCSYCDKQKAWLAVRCTKCGHLFPCKRPGADRPACPRCRDSRVAGATERPPVDARP